METLLSSFWFGVFLRSEKSTEQINNHLSIYKDCYIFKRWFNSLLLSRSFPTFHWEAACILLNSSERWSSLQLPKITKTHCREFGFNYCGVVPKSRDKIWSRVCILILLQWLGEESVMSVCCDIPDEDVLPAGQQGKASFHLTLL